MLGVVVMGVIVGDFKVESAGQLKLCAKLKETKHRIAKQKKVFFIGK